MVQFLFAVGFHPESALWQGHQSSGDAEGKEMSRKFPGNAERTSSGAILMGHGENRAWGEALFRDGEDLQASPSGPCWSRHWFSSIEHCRDLTQSLIERNHSTLKGVQVKSIPTWRGGPAGGAGHC